MMFVGIRALPGATDTTIAGTVTFAEPVAEVLVTSAVTVTVPLAVVVVGETCRLPKVKVEYDSPKPNG